MDNSSIPTDHARHADSRASIGTYILFAVSAVMTLTAIVQIVSPLKQNVWLLSIVTVLFIIAVLYCVAIVVWRAAVAQQPADRQRVSMRASVGSLLSGLFTVVFADDLTSQLLVIILGMLLVIVALCVIGIIILVKNHEGEEIGKRVGSPRVGLPVEQSQAQREYVTQTYRPPVQAQAPAMNSLSSRHEPMRSSPPPPLISPSRSQGALNIMPTEPSGLPSLFEGDELYVIPRNTRARLFILTKSNDMLENCEDACAISSDETRFALCDGVSASKFARPWARLLALQWITQPSSAFDVEALDAWLKEPRRRWLDWVNDTWFSKINERNRSMGRVEFTQAEVKKFTDQGASATFLGLTIDKAISTWSAIAVGDTCLFHFFHADGGAWNYEGFPLKQSSDFTDGPASITTRPHSAALAASHLVSMGGGYIAGDIFVMATDALAMWLFRQLEQKQLESIITLLGQMEQGTDDEVFAKLVEQQRAEKRLTDDDTTLIIIHP
jgi:hypothetical protein